MPLACPINTYMNVPAYRHSLQQMRGNAHSLKLCLPGHRGAIELLQSHNTAQCSSPLTPSPHSAAPEEGTLVTGALSGDSNNDFLS